MSNTWLSAGAGFAGVLTGWAVAFFRYRVQQEANRLRNEQLEIAMTKLAEALEKHAAATWEEIRVINAHLWELAGRPKRRPGPRN